MVDSGYGNVVCYRLPQDVQATRSTQHQIMCTVARVALWVLQVQVFWLLSPGSDLVQIGWMSNVF